MKKRERWVAAEWVAAEEREERRRQEIEANRFAPGVYFVMCPRCGSSDFSSSAIGVIKGDQDPNRCECNNCGCKWRGNA